MNKTKGFMVSVQSAPNSTRWLYMIVVNIMINLQYLAMLRQETSHCLPPGLGRPKASLRISGRWTSGTACLWLQNRMHIMKQCHAFKYKSQEVTTIQTLEVKICETDEKYDETNCK